MTELNVPIKILYRQNGKLKSIQWAGFCYINVAVYKLKQLLKDHSLHLEYFPDYYFTRVYFNIKILLHT